MKLFKKTIKQIFRIFHQKEEENKNHMNKFYKQ